MKDVHAYYVFGIIIRGSENMINLIYFVIYLSTY